MQSRNFLFGRMNLDDDERALGQGEHREAYNFIVNFSENSDKGAGKNSDGNIQVYNINFGTNAKCVGGVADERTNKIYLLIASDSGGYLVEWDERNESATKVLEDTRSGAANVLNLDPDRLIKSIFVITDTDNGVDFLTWVDANEPRCFNIATAKTFGANGFSEKDIALIKAPPIYPPSIALVNNQDIPNNILEEFLEFGYRWRYKDNFYSPISPFSPPAFGAKSFDYDFSTGSNEAMVNKYSQVDITFDTGDYRVEAIDLVFKRSGENKIYIIETYEKDLHNYQDDEQITISFTNDKRFSLFPSDEIGRPFDRVPRNADAMEVIDNRIVFGQYRENYNMVDDDGDDIDVQLTLDFESTAITDSGGYGSVKSIRNYEAVIIYYDKYSRGSTALGSLNSAVFIPSLKCNKQNQLVLTISNNAPYWATHYRIALRQARIDYNTITPVIFHQDGVFTWIKLEGDDQDKVNKGDFIYVKSDTNGIREEAVQTEVLELTTKDKNFLEPDTETETIQDAGVYMKIKASNFAINLNNASVFTEITKGFKSRTTKNYVTPAEYAIYEAIYYGVDGLDDASSNAGTGTYSGTSDLRYEIEIDALGTPDTFQWRTVNANTGAASAYTTGVNCSTSPVGLSNGVTVTFAADTGHDLDDSWVISAKANDVIEAGNVSRNAWVPYRGENVANEALVAGATIKISYREDRDGNELVDYTQTFIASQAYANLEEWFFGDNIISQIIYPTSLAKVVFRRGAAVYKDSGFIETISLDETKEMWMLFLSKVGYSGGERITVNASIEITELQNNLIFETKPIEESNEVYYEIGKTYSISSGLHQGDVTASDTSQTSSLPARLHLDFINCFAWSNGYESYKIRDKLNERTFNLKTRATSTDPNYRENTRTGIIFGERYSQETNYNGLNEFNPSKTPPIWLDLDDKYGVIKFLHVYANRLMVFQEHKIIPVGYFTRVIYDQAGNPSLVQSDDPFTILEPVAGDHGMGDPATFCRDGNNMYWTDPDRGQYLRYGADGISVISRYKFTEFFREEFKNNPGARRIGEFDPHLGQVMLSSQDQALVITQTLYCGNEIFKLSNASPHSYTFYFGAFDTELTISYNVIAGQIDIQADYDGTPYSELNATGSGTLVINRTDLDVDFATVTITPDSTSTYSLAHSCQSIGINKVKIIVINDPSDYDGMGASMVHRYNIEGGSSVFSESNVFDQSGTTLFKTLTGFEGQDPIPDDGDDINLEAYSALIADHLFNDNVGNRIGYLVSGTDYGVSQISAILAAATFPSVYVTDDAGSRTTEIDFTFNKGTSTDILYLIFDYRNILVDAINNSVSIFWGETIDIPVLSNDIYQDPITVTVQTNPSHGTAAVLPNNTIRYTHDGGSDASDSFTYTIENQYGSDTATVNITLAEDTGSGSGGGSGSNPGLAFDMSTSSRSTSALACSDLTGTGYTKYHDGINAYPFEDDTIYNESGKITKFNGGFGWWKDDVGRALLITDQGRVTATAFCGY